MPKKKTTAIAGKKAAIDETAGYAVQSRTKRKYIKRKKNVDLREVKNLLLKMISMFEEDLTSGQGFSEFWGEKETPVSAITKLVQIFLKLIEVEAGKSGTKDKGSENLAEEDFLIISKYLEQAKS